MNRFFCFFCCVLVCVTFSGCCTEKVLPAENVSEACPKCDARENQVTEIPPEPSIPKLMPTRFQEDPIGCIAYAIQTVAGTGIQAEWLCYRSRYMGENADDCEWIWCLELRDLNGDAVPELLVYDRPGSSGGIVGVYAIDGHVRPIAYLYAIYVVNGMVTDVDGNRQICLYGVAGGGLSWQDEYVFISCEDGTWESLYCVNSELLADHQSQPQWAPETTTVYRNNDGEVVEDPNDELYWSLLDRPAEWYADIERVVSGSNGEDLRNAVLAIDRAEKLLKQWQQCEPPLSVPLDRAAELCRVNSEGVLCPLKDVEALIPNPCE